MLCPFCNNESRVEYCGEYINKYGCSNHSVRFYFTIFVGSDVVDIYDFDYKQYKIKVRCFVNNLVISTKTNNIILIRNLSEKEVSNLTFDGLIKLAKRHLDLMVFD